MLDLEIGLLLVALFLGGYGLYRLLQRRADERYGGLVALDNVAGSFPALRSERWRMAGRPDEIRARRDGRWVPIEWKSRPAPPGGPYRSHEVQLWAYLALIEEVRGTPPPYGILRYGDGTEYRVPWDPRARSELGRLRTRISQPYRGEHLASPGKCAGCRFREICDVRAV
jgi:CRISPR/Cas system-associated exonuclease Cas4 (RecB family)